MSDATTPTSESGIASHLALAGRKASTTSTTMTVAPRISVGRSA